MPARKLPTLPHLAADAWLLLQQALAATLAWLIATRVMQAPHPVLRPDRCRRGAEHLARAAGNQRGSAVDGCGGGDHLRRGWPLAPWSRLLRAWDRHVPGDVPGAVSRPGAGGYGAGRLCSDPHRKH